MTLLEAASASILGSGSIALPVGPNLPTHETEPAVSTTHFVDPANTSGAASDTYNTTQSQSASTPWLTLTKAVLSAPVNAEVQILGPYTGSGQTVFTTARTGWVYLKAKPGASVTIDGVKFDVNSRYISIEGTTTGGGSTGDLVFSRGIDTVAGAAKIRIRKIPIPNIVLRAAAGAACADVIIEDCTIRPPLNGVCVSMTGNSGTLPLTNITVRRNDMVVDSDDAIHVGNAQFLLVDGNDGHDHLRSDGVAHIDNFQLVGVGADITIRNNKFRDSLFAQGIFASDGPIQRLWIENNLLYGMGGVATYIEIGSNQPGAVILFNTIVGRLRLTEGGTIAVLAGNIITSLSKDNSGGTTTIQNEGYNLVGSTAVTLAGTSVTGAPTYQNAAGGDYRLAAGSTGLGMAVSSFANQRSPTTDRLGVARPVSGNWDVGADGRA